MPSRSAMMPITTNSSTSVNPVRRLIMGKPPKSGMALSCRNAESYPATHVSDYHPLPWKLPHDFPVGKMTFVTNSWTFVTGPEPAIQCSDAPIRGYVYEYSMVRDVHLW